MLPGGCKLKLHQDNQLYNIFPKLIEKTMVFHNKKGKACDTKAIIAAKLTHKSGKISWTL
jgi:hypothetical protein